ncbi:hypothetical protein PENTCL1PPCAC_12080 [Pristionchus entomophagus]|uniref:Proton-coupled zinc antiporter SLC30A9, mitochondrial n=1 Tax=Pristionchus entomophagus TaxID=358040 RepID=A0AAV5T487_9BILA|nr:hypothetical protein PENTCL1PPCAC_12080 [Pristionchus entomophagus]
MAPLILKVPPSVFSGAVNQVLRLGLRHRANCMVVASAVRWTSTTSGDEEGKKMAVPLPTDSLDHLSHKEKKRLFRVARVSKRSRTYDDDKIDKLSAMATYNLSEQDLEDLPQVARPAKTYTSQASNRTIYALTDVYQKAVKKHGSIEAIATHRANIVDMRKELSNAERMRLRMRVEAANADANAGADRVVGIAFALNTCDMLMKFTAAYLTGSKSLFAEAIHSTMDTCNQLILLLGIRYSGKNPDGQFPYGYGNMRYVTSLISGCGILGFGCGLSMYHGISGLLNPTALEPLTYAYYALFMSLCFQGTSAVTAYREVNRKAKLAGISIMNYVKTSADPSLNVVLLEDTAAVTGVGIALCAISLSSILNSPIPDSCGSIIIGALLGTVAMFIIRTNAAHLVGRSLPDRITNDIVARLSNDPVVRSVHDVKTTSLGVEHSRFKAEIDFDGRAITRAYLKEEADTAMMLREAQSLQSTAQLEEFMEEHGEKIIDRVGEEIDRIEGEITKKHKDIRHVDLEAL